ncbi:hypothetical protein HG535_0A05820 [Zygotorulaspora mrakii]|uniref:Growth regulation protein n=1 Tax=Zygotorulaspora mrakii TaxID=42260 RepID=A0A7H9AWJ4_ZYGMR|nr:uncharacterized protein HG535_0A05820 [Zygotorulaspora mrakii]QLG70641.1 hypothetical protein HG535_0A05820 [Zygotorulaspora mrakii]
MENIITQVSQDTGANGFLKDQVPSSAYDDDIGNDSENGNSLIHLNIQDKHYYITRDQLMSLPESLLLCLFPSGVFLDCQGQVITNLTPDDEVYISNFSPKCFEYIMEAYTKAYDDLINFPINKLFDRSVSGRDHPFSAKGFFFFSGSNPAANQNNNENDILHDKPTIIVLREDLDYYCVPQSDFQFDNKDTSDDLLYHVMAQVKAAAGSYLTNKTSIFQGLYSSNRLRNSTANRQSSATVEKFSKEKELGPAEQHLMDMLCSSGFERNSTWGNRTQEPDKTVISSLSLCRIANETTEEFREKYFAARNRWDSEIKQAHENSLTPVGSTVSVNSLSRTTSNNNAPVLTSSHALTPTASASNISSHHKPHGEKRKSRLSALADNVRSRSSSSQRSSSKQRVQEAPKLYDLVPKPDINPKLLLFWRKPARKCWWGEEEIDLQVEIYGSWSDQKTADNKKMLSLKTPVNVNDGLNKITIPVRLHIRRVWTLELSAIGVD